MAKLLWFVLAISAWPCLSEGSKILVVFPFPNRSHTILGDGFVRILVKEGHEVTYITPFPIIDAPPPPNLRYIDVSGNVAAFSAATAAFDLKGLIDKTSESVIALFLKGFLKKDNDLLALLNSTFSSADMQKLLNNPNEKFDLVIIEWTFIEVYAGLAVVYDCPFVWVSSANPGWTLLSLIDETPNPSYFPDTMSSKVPPLNFLDRVKELLMQAVFRFFKILMRRGEEQSYNAIFGPIIAKQGKPLPPYTEVIHNASLIFGNSHESVGGSRTLPPNYKSIGGYHINPEVKPLPENLKKIIENAEDGVIYFSLGSNVKSKDFPDEIKKSLLKMFGELKYTVIWKFEEKLSGVPKNVHILQWAPQPSILAHPNCKLFITHGGLLSTTETVHFGVPIIGIPVFADQFANVEISKQRGFALRVDLSYQMADDLKNAIEEILGNPKHTPDTAYNRARYRQLYKQRIDELNLVYHDRPVPPAKELVHWVDHVIRTNGAPHLRSVALVVPWYQKLYLDLLALVLVVVFIVTKALKLICCSSKQRVSSQKKKN